MAARARRLLNPYPRVRRLEGPFDVLVPLGLGLRRKGAPKRDGREPPDEEEDRERHRQGDSPLVDLGDWPGWTLVLASAGLMFVGGRTVARRERHRRRPG